MMDRKFWHGVVKALDKEMHLEHKPHGTLQFPVLPEINYASFANLTQGELDTIEPIPYTLLTVDWAKNSAYYKYMIRFTYPKWDHGKYYAIHVTGESVESPYFAKLLMEQVTEAGLIELTEQEKHDKLLYEKQKEWIEKQQKEGWGYVNFQEAYDHFSDSKYLGQLQGKLPTWKIDEAVIAINNDIKDMEPWDHTEADLETKAKKLADFYGISYETLLHHAKVTLHSIKYQQEEAKAFQAKLPSSQQWSDSGTKLIQVVPGLSHPVMDGCPDPKCTYGDGFRGRKLEEIIIHLNDHHKWPRVAGEEPKGWPKARYGPYNGPNIADWVEEYALEMHLDMTFHTVEEKELERDYPPF